MRRIHRFTAMALSGLLAAGLLTMHTATAAPIPSGPAALRVVPTAAAYPLIPLLTGGILETQQEVSLQQSIRVREADPDPDGCNPYSDGTMTVQDVQRASSLIDLGYDNVPRANPAPPTSIPVSQTSASGGFTVDANAWACRGTELFLAQGGRCTHTFSTIDAGRLMEPKAHSLQSSPYTVGKSERVVAVAAVNPGLDCPMRSGEIPMAPGLYSLDYLGDARFQGAFVRWSTIMERDSLVNRYDMAKNDTSCVYGPDWWLNQHSTGMYVWTGSNMYGDNDSVIATCSSNRSGFAQSEVKRALVVNEVKIWQMTPAGGYVEVPPSGKVIDGNTVKIEMLIENRWRSDITTQVRLWDNLEKRQLEPEKGQLNPLTETFVAGAQKKVTFLWRSDGTAWDSAQNPRFQRNIDILTPYGGTQVTVYVKPRPALLLHGWNSSAAAWAAWPGFVSGVRPDWDVVAVGGMQTDPKDGVSIQENAAVAGQAIQRIRTQVGAVHVDLVGHSMGGLISRWYLSRMMGQPAGDGRPVVRSLTMFGTPNLGSDCAYEVLGAGLTAVGTASLFTSGQHTGRSRFVPTFQLTPSYIAGEFFDQTPPVKGVYYGHRAGIPIPVFPCGLKDGQSGPNDGPVVLPSVLGKGRGGLPIAAPDFTIHTSMTDKKDYFTSARDKVLGLGPEKAVKLVSTRSAPARSPRAGSPVQVTGTWFTGAGEAFDGSSSLSLTTPGGLTRVSVAAPSGARVVVTGPKGETLADDTASQWPLVVEKSVSAGAITVATTGTAGGDINAALSLPGDSRSVTASARRTGANVVITAKAAGPGAAQAQLKALVMTAASSTVVALKRTGTTWTATVKVGTANDVQIVVGARISGQDRLTFLGI